MEDRITPVLYLELSDDPPEIYAEKRVDALLACPDVERATWWASEVPGRDEFGARMRDFPTLGVYEASREFTPPPAPEGLRTLQFRHYPRPGQGTFSGKPTLGLELVLISPATPGGAQALRDWADFIHIHYIAAAHVPGFGMITPYENVAGGEPLYMHFYEMDTDKAEEAFQRMVPETQRLVGHHTSELYQQWFMHEELVIDYVNTFRRVGASPEKL